MTEYQILSLSNILEELSQGENFWGEKIARAAILDPWQQPEQLKQYAAILAVDLKTQHFNFGVANNIIIGIVAEKCNWLYSLIDVVKSLVAGYQVYITQLQTNALLTAVLNCWIQECPDLQFLIKPEVLNLKGVTKVIVSQAVAFPAQKNRKIFQHANNQAVAVLSGNETDTQLDALAFDIMFYFGRMPQNAKMLLVPEGYNLVPLCDKLQKYLYCTDLFIYSNHYEYQRFTLLMNQIPHLDAGMLLLREYTAMQPPVAVLHYQYYTQLSDYESVLKNANFVIGNQEDMYPFGVNAQRAIFPNPQLELFLQS